MKLQQSVDHELYQTISTEDDKEFKSEIELEQIKTVVDHDIHTVNKIAQNMLKQHTMNNVFINDDDQEFKEEKPKKKENMDLQDIYVLLQSIEQTQRRMEKEIKSNKNRLDNEERTLKELENETSKEMEMKLQTLHYQQSSQL